MGWKNRRPRSGSYKPGFGRRESDDFDIDQKLSIYSLGASARPDRYITMAMYYEFLAIILSRATYLAMLPHRYVFNLGYSEGEVTSTGLLLVAMIVEIAFELCIDVIAMQTESKNIDFEEFWRMWRMSKSTERARNVP